MASSTSLLANQVGGHPGVRSSADGSQILKPCLPAERDFYERVVTTDVKGFEALRKHVPGFYGVAPAEGTESKDESTAGSSEQILT
jgi:1D-myo-inositol-tetrakisphosphate 5-kinase/inositol-polyphosphate multikinase